MTAKGKNHMYNFISFKKQANSITSRLVSIKTILHKLIQSIAVSFCPNLEVTGHLDDIVFTFNCRGAYHSNLR